MSDRLVEISEDSARGSFFLFTGNASYLLILALGSIVIARLLGPENFGLYSLALVIPTILAGFIDFGIASALTRFSAKLRAEGKDQLAASMLRSGLIFEFLVGAAMSAICFIFSNTLAAYILNRPTMGFYVKLAAVLILFQTIFNALQSAFVGLDRMEQSALIMNVQSVVKTVSAPILILLGFSLAGAIVGQVTSFMVAGIVGSLILFSYMRGLGKLHENGFSSDLKVMLSYGFPLYLSSLLLLFISQYQSIILAFFASNAAIGNFAVATTLSATLNILTYPLRVLFPAFSKINPKGDELRKLFKLSVKYTTLLIVPASIAVAAISKDLVYAFYGSSYGQAPAFLSFYILVFLYTGLGSIVLSYLFSGIGETRVVFKFNLINLAIFLPLAPMLTLFYGVLGLIGAYLISNLVSLVYGLFIAKRRFDVKPSLRESLKIYLAAALSAVPTLAYLHFSPFNHFSNIVVGGLVYLLAYLTLTPLVGGVCQHDLENLKMIFSRVRFAQIIIKPLLGYEERILKLTFPST